MGRRRLCRLGAPAAAGMLLVCAPPEAAAEAGPAPFSRIFLEHGEDLVAYGDYARVGGRVVFSLPLTAEPAAGGAQLVGIPAGTVDWETTERYAESVRDARHAAARGGAVQVVALLDDAGAADAAGDGVRFSLVAAAARSRPMPLLPPPSLQEIIARALTVARLTRVPEERIAILRAAVAALGDSRSAVDAEWRAATRAAAVRDLDAELRSEAGYLQMGRTALDDAAAYAQRADVRGVRSVVAVVLERDGALGRRRPDYLSSLLAALDGHLADARAQRLERDRRQLRAEEGRRYGDAISEALRQLAGSRALLDDVRLLAGPDAGALPALSGRFAETAGALRVRAPAAEAGPAHDLLRQAFTLAARAARGRYEAVRDGDLRAAWDAAASAAGALMLFDRAAAEFDRALRNPQLPC